MVIARGEHSHSHRASKHKLKWQTNILSDKPSAEMSAGHWMRTKRVLCTCCTNLFARKHAVACAWCVHVEHILHVFCACVRCVACAFLLSAMKRFVRVHGFVVWQRVKNVVVFLRIVLRPPQNMCNYHIDTYQFSHHQIHLVHKHVSFIFSLVLYACTYFRVRRKEGVYEFIWHPTQKTKWAKVQDELFIYILRLKVVLI